MAMMMMLVMMVVVAMMMMVVATYGSEGVLGDVVALQVNSGERGVRLHFICFGVFYLVVSQYVFVFPYHWCHFWGCGCPALCLSAFQFLIL